MRSWRKLSSKLLLDHPRLSIYEDDVELPNGHRTKYLRYGDRGGAACVIAIDDQGRVLVQKEYSYPPDAWIYQLPGGAINAGESPKDGAARELAEEAGVSGDLTEVGWFYINNRRTADKFYVFKANNLQKVTAEKDIEEEFETFWITPDEIDELIKNNEIPTHSFLSAWLLFKTKYPELLS